MIKYSISIYNKLVNIKFLQIIKNAAKQQKKVFLIDEAIVDKLEELAKVLEMSPEEIVWVSLWLLEKSAGRKVEITDKDERSAQLVTKVIDYFSKMQKVTNL